MEDTPGLRYGSMIEPYWVYLNESWEDDPTEFLARLEKVPLPVRHLYAGHWCQSEVRNGGLSQFFSNTTGILAPEAVAGYRATGAQQWATIVDEAMRLLGSTYPRRRGDRNDALVALEEASPKCFDVLDNRFVAWTRDDYNRWDRLADAYAETA